MDSATVTIPELAARLGVDPTRIRTWMRRQNWRHPSMKGSPWNLTTEQVAEVAAHFDTERVTEGARQMSTADDEGPLAGLTVGELLATYNDVLMELRARGLTRTDNAPIGDLAEYCAAVVYGGTLAPNSEKSHDLVAADGRKVQVKVRLLRSATSLSAGFSPIRSFDFDVCVFMLVDNGKGRVVTAREWTADEVQEHGRHRIHSNGTVVRIGQIRRDAIGVDRTGEFDSVWLEILAQRRMPNNDSNSESRR